MIIVMPWGQQLGDKGYALKYADIITHSYHPVKSFTTGEGVQSLQTTKS